MLMGEDENKCISIIYDIPWPCSTTIYKIGSICPSKSTGLHLVESEVVVQIMNHRLHIVPLRFEKIWEVCTKFLEI